MMAHVFQYPNSASPTATITLNPSLVMVQDGEKRPVQRVLEAQDGTLYTFQTTSNRPNRFEVVVDRLHEADTVSYSGYSSLASFFEYTVSYALTSFTFTHTDGASAVVKLITLPWKLEENSNKAHQWSGRFMLQTVV